MIVGLESNLCMALNILEIMDLFLIKNNVLGNFNPDLEPMPAAAIKAANLGI